MIFIDRDVVPQPEVFFSNEITVAQKRLEEFYSRRRSSRSQEKFSKPFEPQLRDGFLQALRKVFNAKCAYCESDVNLASSHSEYDHFRPKSGARGLENEFSNDHYWWLTYEWKNLYYSCTVCNRYKSTWFPVLGNRCKVKSPYLEVLLKEEPLLIDPCNEKPEEHLVFMENGQVDFLSQKGRTTIEILKLNRSELVNARKEELQKLYGQWEEFINLFRNDRYNSRIIEIVKDWERLFITNQQSFLGAKRQVLSKWIERRLDIQAYLANIGKSAFKQLSIVASESLNIIGKVESFNKKEELSSHEKEEIDKNLKIESAKHIYVEKIELKNFKCFSHLELDFRKEASENAVYQPAINQLNEPWLLFLGENGVGKSSILKAMVIGLCGKEYLDKLRISGKEILKHEEQEGYIKIHLVGGIRPIVVNFNEVEIKTSLFQPIVNLAAYNSIRLMPKKGKLIPEKGEFYGAKAQNLFDYSVSLIDANNWLLTRSKKVFDRAALTLKDLMFLGEKDRIAIEEDRIVVVRNEEIFTIDELSDGYQSIFALAIDIMATFVNENVTFDLAEGMVLIDEIGTHLHPRWRMEVVERLRNAFPKLCFVVTTHEPLCLRGLKAGETVVFTRNIDKEVIALTDLPDPSELRVDQILTSDFFGLKSTIDPNTEKLFDEYYAILALEETDRTEEDRNRLLQLQSTIPKMKHLGDDLREELIVYVIDELLAKKIRENGPKITKALKSEAIKRVESLWDLITLEKGSFK